MKLHLPESTDIVEPDTSYRIVFNGNIADGRDPDNVRRDFIRLFKIDQTRVEDYFSGKPVVLKKGLDHETASRLMKAMEHAGILCILENSAEEPLPVTVDAPQPSASSTMTCPKCGHVQQESEECSRCGLIIKKYNQPGFIGDPGACRIVFYDGVKEKKQLVLVFLSLLLAFTLYWEVRGTREITYPAGVLLKSEPQMALIGDPKPWKVGNKDIFPLVQFWLQGRVLCSERYDNDFMSDVSPIDIGLGWGPMSDQSVIDHLDFVQGNRKLEYESSDPERPPPSFDSLWEYVKNVHTLPADDDIKKKVCSVRKGDLLELRGYLIGIKENGQWTQISSLKKEVGLDHTTCLIFWVTQFKKLDAKNLK